MQGSFLLGAGGLELPVAALAFLDALDQCREPVGGLQQLALGVVQHAAGQVLRRPGRQFLRQQAGHGAGALGLHGLVGGAQGVVFVFYRRRHISG